MNCEKYLHLIDDLLEDELDAQIAEQAAQHAFACPDCAAELNIAKQEKAMYARFLFDAEPSENLRTRLFAQINGETEAAQDAEFYESAARRKSSFFGFLNFSPTFAGVALLLIFGLIFGLTKFASDDKTVVEQARVETNLPEAGIMPNGSELFERSAPENFTEKLETVKIIKKTKNLEENHLSEKNQPAKKIERRAADSRKNNKLETNEKTFAPRGKSAAGTETAQISEEEKAQRVILAALETEAARQIEKIELLLRSFRNVRSPNKDEVLDIAYEQQQARKLLEKHVRLRRAAENFGTLYAEELFGKVEPLLLDIANLEKNAAPERVRDIKERVSSQNIIASLQIY